MAEGKKVSIYIPKDVVSSTEKTKKVFINDEMFLVPIGKTIEVPETVANVIREWLDNLSKIESDREERMEKIDEK